MRLRYFRRWCVVCIELCHSAEDRHKRIVRSIWTATRLFATPVIEGRAIAVTTARPGLRLSQSSYTAPEVIAVRNAETFVGQISSLARKGRMAASPTRPRHPYTPAIQTHSLHIGHHQHGPQNFRRRPIRLPRGHSWNQIWFQRDHRRSRFQWRTAHTHFRHRSCSLPADLEIETPPTLMFHRACTCGDWLFIMRNISPRITTVELPTPVLSNCHNISLHGR